MTDFNVGDAVKIINDDNYSITKIGSYGTVVSVIRDHVRIDFEYTPFGIKDIYTIAKKDVKLTKIYSKEERLCRKIQILYRRQRERGINHV